MKQRIFRTVIAAAAVAAGAFLSACFLFLDTPDSLFDEGEDAIATNRAASNIETAEFLYEFGDGKEMGTATVRYKEPDRVRIDVLDGERTMVFCLTGASGWMFVRGELFDMSVDDIEEMHATLLQTIPFQVNFQDIFTDAELEEETEYACGEECKVIKAKFRREPDVKVKIWFGVDTDWMRQFEITSEDGVQSMQYFDYRTFEGVTLPSLMFNFSPEGASKIKLISFEANTDIPEYVFRKPEKLSALEGGK